jgi:hypothetical protein
MTALLVRPLRSDTARSLRHREAIFIVPLPAVNKTLIVEADAEYLGVLLRVLEVYPHVEAVGDFQTAYDRLATRNIKMLITNLNLEGTVEGLHLAYAVATGGYPTRTLVYADRIEPWVIRELQRAGAFHETQARLPFALPSYVQAKLPVLDRRDPVSADRRAGYRGGRRPGDVPFWNRR